VDKEPLEPIAFPIKEYGQFILNVKRLFPEFKLLLAFATRSLRFGRWQDGRGHISDKYGNKEIYSEEHQENWCSCADLILQYCSDPILILFNLGAW